MKVWLKAMRGRREQAASLRAILAKGIAMITIEIDGPGLQHHSIPVEATSTISLEKRTIDDCLWYVFRVDGTDYKLVPVDQPGSFRAMQHAVDGVLGRLYLEALSDLANAATVMEDL